jgi:hypothetical protein
MRNKQQSSVDKLIDQVEDFMGLIPVDMVKQAQFNHLSESIDFALFALAGEMINDFPEETKTRLKATIELKYKEFYKL